MAEARSLKEVHLESLSGEERVEPHQGKSFAGLHRSKGIRQVEEELRPLLLSMAGESRKVYREEGLTVNASCEKGMMFGPCLEISSTGLRFLVSSLQAFSIEKGQEIALTVASPQGKSSVIQAAVKSVEPFESQQEKNSVVVFAEFNDSFPSELYLSNMRGSPLVTLPMRYQPQATSGDPLFSTGYILYRVEAFTSKGARLHTCGRGVPVLPGFHIQLRILLPNTDELLVQTQILKVTPDVTDGGFFLDVVFIDLSPDHEAAIAEHLLFANPRLSIKEMKNSGFFLDSARKALRVSFCNTHSDWLAVLNLRLMAYQSVGKFLEKKSAHEMQDRFDSYARQIIVKSGEKVVGAMRIVFVDQKRERSEHVAMGIKVPDELFNMSIVEASRACTDPSYRGEDVFLMLIQKGFETCIQTSHDLVLANCNPEMWPLYKKIGYRKLGVRFSSYGRDDCELIYNNPKQVLYGRAHNFLHWGYFWSDTVGHVLRNPSEHLSWKDKAQAVVPLFLQRFITRAVQKQRRMQKYRQLRSKRAYVAAAKAKK